MILLLGGYYGQHPQATMEPSVVGCEPEASLSLMMLALSVSSPGDRKLWNWSTVSSKLFAYMVA